MKIRPYGFTLIELLVVITIIAILSVMGMAVYGGLQKNARDAKRRTDLDAIAKALAQYYVQKKYYLPSGNVGSGSWGCGLTISPWSNCDLLQSELAPYMSNIPYDPQDSVVSGGNVNCGTNPCYMYETPNADHQTFCICTKLENPPSQTKPANCPTYGNYCVTNQL